MKMCIGGKYVEVIQTADELLDTIIRCPNCGNETSYGETSMCSGFVGCDNVLPDGKQCYFEDLQPRIFELREKDYQSYVEGTCVYREFCTNCEQYTVRREVTETQTFRKAGIEVQVEVDFYVCTRCKDAIYNLSKGKDPFQEAKEKIKNVERTNTIQKRSAYK